MILSTPSIELFNLIKSNNAFNVIELERGKIYSEGEFEFSFYKMEHPAVSHGIKLTSHNKTLVYSGDSTINGDIDSLVNNADLCLLDGCFLECDYLPTKPHMSIKQVCEIANKYSVKTIVTHISYNYTDEVVEEEINKYSSLCEVAKEGVTYKV